MSFKNFLIESKEKHAVLAFGRMNPPTTGHEVLVNKVKEIARQNKATLHIVLSTSQDKAKNPLTPEQKLKHAKRFFPGVNITLATKEHPTFLQQAALLFERGVTHLHMVAGSDRVTEYKRLLNTYNGTGEKSLFNFKHIEVHSAGERDPDAEGTTGMSASKMRSLAASGNFDQFKQGVPETVSEKYAMELYNDVRKGMGLKENVVYETNPFYLLAEGVEDKAIFKAVFLGGGPGSGKDFVLDNTLTGHGYIEINSDKALEYLMDKEGLDKKMPDEEEQKRNVVRKRAKSITDIRERLAIYGRNGLIINGTGDDPEKYAKIKKRLEDMGYETMMVLVNTNDAVSEARNIERGQRGGRTVPENIRKEKWDAVQAARGTYNQMFGDRYIEFDNSEDLRIAPKSVQDQKNEEMLDIFRSVQKFTQAPPKNEVAQQWIAGELEKKDTRSIPTSGAKQIPKSDDSAAKEAQSLGLEYYGFGRYGKNGKATHRSVGGRLVVIPTSREDTPRGAKTVRNIQTPVSSQNREKLQKVKSKSKLKFKEDIDSELSEMMRESFDLSDSSSLNLLLLGNRIDEYDIEVGQVQESSYIKNGKGDVRVFMLRSAAATEAHIKNGTVVPYKNGYVVKLNKEKQNVDHKENSKHVQERRAETSSERGTYLTESGSKARGQTSRALAESSSFSASRTGKEVYGQATAKKTITLEEVRNRKKALQKESIDKGIEPGLSMAASGENPFRSGSGEKIRKKTGKVDQVYEVIGDGGEMATSMSDNNENQLRNKGITLKSWKAKRVLG